MAEKPMGASQCRGAPVTVAYRYARHHVVKTPLGPDKGLIELNPLNLTPSGAKRIATREECGVRTALHSRAAAVANIWFLSLSTDQVRTTVLRQLLMFASSPMRACHI